MHVKFITYLKFLSKSTNQHGVHSPFVFNYVTKCLYSEQKKHSNKSINILLKSNDYFNFDRIKVLGSPSLDGEVKKMFQNQNQSKDSIDVLYTEKLNLLLVEEILKQDRLHNDSMILIDSIYQSPKKHQAWKKLITSPKITVSMDLFHCGVLFIRKEQEKEHFIIRI
ncbi:hypothetical protein [Flagellimonas pacifica]|uniref:Uncharacterized protein n=1 Tax=Flagellimonas pacifica TaxID=1247520 RepID=A0A285MUU9_9FLAO|nr:hypothetical protein [Allomuricauda parva]SNZ00317.1 hypothetical protein SAMN06265377_2137 [Allomuricauda parva]